MPTVFCTAALRGALSGCAGGRFHGTRLSEVITAVDAEHPGFALLVTGAGLGAGEVVIFVDDVQVPDSADPLLGEESRVDFLTVAFGG